MGPPSYTRSVVDQNFFMWCMTVLTQAQWPFVWHTCTKTMIPHTERSTGSGGLAGFDMLSPGAISETTVATDSVLLS